jgi:flagellar basal body-associated protein FliL
MRRIVVALVVASLALALVGCGKKAEETTTEQAPAATKPAAKPAEAAGTVDRSANDYDLAPVAFPSFATTDTPAVFKDKLDAGRPMLIVFEDSGQQQTATLRAEVDAVMNEYRGLVDLITFNVAGDAADPNVQAAVTYAAELGVNSTPYTIIVDRGGFITWRNKGFAERGVIEREVERASR